MTIWSGSWLQLKTNLDGVVDKLFATVLAWLCAFRTLSHGVLSQESSHHSCSTLVLTVNTLLGTNALVILTEKKKTHKTNDRENKGQSKIQNSRRCFIWF